MNLVLCLFLTTTMSRSSEPARPGAGRAASGDSAGQLFPLAWVYESSALARSPHAHPRKAWVAFAYNIRWMYVESEAVSPRTLFDFEAISARAGSVGARATWAEVEREVYAFEGNTDGRPALRVPGRVVMAKSSSQPTPTQSVRGTTGS